MQVVSRARGLLGALAMVVMFSLDQSASAAVVMSNNYAAVVASDGIGSSATNTYVGLGIPTNTLLSVTDGASYSSNQIKYSTTADQVSFLNTFEQRRAGGANSVARAIEAEMFFTVSEDTAFALTGRYAVDDVGATGRVAFFQVYLVDATTGQTLFSNSQHSLATSDQVFALGGADGDYLNTIAGSSSGVLVGGHTFRWYFNNFIEVRDGADDLGASASGYVSLAIGGSEVPEPGGLLLVVTAVGLAAIVRRASGRRPARLSCGVCDA